MRRCARSTSTWCPRWSNERGGCHSTDRAPDVTIAVETPLQDDVRALIAELNADLLDADAGRVPLPPEAGRDGRAGGHRLRCPHRRAAPSAWARSGPRRRLGEVKRMYHAARGAGDRASAGASSPPSRRPPAPRASPGWCSRPATASLPPGASMSAPASAAAAPSSTMPTPCFDLSPDAAFALLD